MLNSTQNINVIVQRYQKTAYSSKPKESLAADSVLILKFILIIHQASAFYPASYYISCISPLPSASAEKHASCKEGDVTHQPNAIWKPEPCRLCVCDKGSIVCEDIRCEELKGCEHFSVPEGECCPVCQRFASARGRIGEQYSLRPPEGDTSFHINTERTRPKCHYAMISLLPILYNIIYNLLSYNLSWYNYEHFTLPLKHIAVI